MNCGLFAFVLGLKVWSRLGLSRRIDFLGIWFWMEPIGFLSNLFGFPGIWLGIGLQKLGFEGWSELGLFGLESSKFGLNCTMESSKSYIFKGELATAAA